MSVVTTARRGTPESQQRPLAVCSEPGERRAVLGLAGVFAVSRFLYAIAGVRFETTAPLKTYMLNSSPPLDRGWIGVTVYDGTAAVQISLL